MKAEQLSAFRDLTRLWFLHTMYPVAWAVMQPYVQALEVAFGLDQMELSDCYYLTQDRLIEAVRLAAQGETLERLIGNA